MIFRRLHCSSILKSAARSLHGVFTGDTVDLALTCIGNINHGSSQPPVIIIHGILASKNSWINVGEAIHKTTGRTVISVDARNHGDSQHSSENTYFNMAHDTMKLIKKLDLSKVSLLGHSMGGRTAMVISLLNPQLISSMILVDVSPLLVSKQLSSNITRLLKLIMAVDFMGIANVEEATIYAKKALHASGLTQKAVVDFILLKVGMKPDGTVGWMPNMEVLKESLPTLLKFPDISGKYLGPVMFIGAEQSNFLPPNDFEGIQNYFPLAQLKYIPGVGHNIHKEDPSTLLRLTTEFLLKYTV